MKRTSLRLLYRGAVLSAISFGIAVPAAFGIVSTCPPAVPRCLDEYGSAGPTIWLCCKEDNSNPYNPQCYDYFKQKTVCNTPPEQPVTYGWTITSTHLFDGNCTAGQGQCY